jgi:integrase
MSKTSANKLPQYVYRTTFGVFRFRRNVPKDIMGVSGRKLWYKVLGKDYKDAMRTYSTALLEFDSFVAWYRREAPLRETILEVVKNEFGEDAMRMLDRGQVDENLEYALMDLSDKVEGTVSEEVSARIYTGSLPPVEVSLSGVLDRYREYKSTGYADKDRLMLNLIKRTKRACEEALGTTAVNDADVSKITRKDVNAVRDYLFGTGLKPNSVVRVISQAQASMNFCIKEDDLNIPNPFQGVLIKGRGATKEDRLPLSKEDIHELNQSFDAPDDIAALWTTLRDTGARLSEIVYLAVGDVDLQNKSVAIRPNAFRGSLKTASSERTIPLSDKALEALQVLRQGKEDDEAIFTRYARPRGADSASAVLMKRCRKVVKDPKKSLHSLRHSMKDALRNSGCPEEMAKALLGHADGSVASRYGSGFTLSVLREAMAKAW